MKKIGRVIIIHNRELGNPFGIVTHFWRDADTGSKANLWEQNCAGNCHGKIQPSVCSKMSRRMEGWLEQPVLMTEKIGYIVVII
ncbi:hypothetical protein [Cohaesibacter haloalkalitolerans]|uniref:hypothetical protein n=1 Tax=Cohaesibacter haloalkalitolerans TaxID=1162980 RepID=UPI0013C48527|nr:hypothetical protein [Cohaesibacter haloalkalitolerans]